LVGINIFESLPATVTFLQISNSVIIFEVISSAEKYLDHAVGMAKLCFNEGKIDTLA